MLKKIFIVFQLFILRFPSYFRGFWVRIWIIINGGKCGKLVVESGFRMKFPPHEGIKIGNNVCLGKETTIDAPIGGILNIGNNVSFTGFTYISVAEAVNIGNEVIIGEFVSIRDANHKHGLSQGYIKNQKMSPNPILIKNNIWLGRGVAVLAGVTIPNGSIIGANAVVVRSLDKENAIYAGTPCEFIKFRK